MTNKKELTHEDAMLLLDWLEGVLGREEVRSYWLTKRCRPELFIREMNNDSIPEKIRRALAERNVLLTQIAAIENSALWLDNIEGKIITASDWDKKTDPTGKHALIRATLEYIKGERDG